jgi:hypothetical protein
MALKIDGNAMTTTAHHVNDGPKQMYLTDARSAVARHPDEWSHEPWDPQAASEARKRLHDRKIAEAKAAGAPEPAPFVEPEYSDEDRAEFDKWKADRDAAAARLAKLVEDEAKQAEIDAQIAADKALVDSSPPQPDPTRRRPLTGAAKANAERTAARRAAETGDPRTPEQKAADRDAEQRRLAGNVGRGPVLTGQD